MLDSGVLEAIKGSDRVNSAMYNTKERDSKNFTWTDYCWSTLLLLTACILWGCTSIMYPDFDGVSVYDLRPELPSPKLMKTSLASNHDDVFVASAKLMDYCILPDVYTRLITPANNKTNEYLTKNGFAALPTDANNLANVWERYDKKVIGRYITEYNLPTGLPLSNGDIAAMSSQYIPPVCVCINRVFTAYRAKGIRADDAEVKKATEAINNCISSQHIVKRQTLLGNDEYENNDMKSRKYISRHAMLFQLCFAFVISMLYNSLDFESMGQNGKAWNPSNTYYFIALGLSPVLLFVLNILSIPSVSAGTGINFSSIIILPGVFVALIIELMWSFAAWKVDIGRQTFMHPATFYLIISALYIIASVENGVFTLSVLVTQIFQACIITMAYACTLFVMHGSIWKTSTSSRTGFFIVILLAGLVCLRHLTPLFPVNISASIFLWLIPTVFGVICFAKVLFVDHMFGDESNTKDKKFIITHSTHLFDIIHCLLTTVVVVYFIFNIYGLSYGDPDAKGTTYNAGKLTSRLNFAFAEMDVTNVDDQPFYKTINQDNKNNFKNTYFVNP